MKGEQVSRAQELPRNARQEQEDLSRPRTQMLKAQLALSCLYEQPRALR